MWKVAKLCGKGLHVTQALPTFHVGEIAKLPAGDITKLEKYVECFDSNASTIQLSTAPPTVARALQLGQALIDLAVVPGAVLKIVIPEAGLTYLVDKAKVTELKKYYTTFSPTLETPSEWDHVKALLDVGVAKYAALARWIHDPHTFTMRTLDALLKNIGDKSGSRPVTLILFSALDWNQAFQQGLELEKLVVDARNLALIVQGTASIAAATSEVTRVADDYGQFAWSWDPQKSWMPTVKRRLGQVVIAGHGSEHGVEMSSPGTGAWADEANNRVGYDQHDIDRSERARQVAWSIDTAHVAVLVQHYRDSSGGMGKQEIAIAARDGRVRGRLGVVAVTGMVASSDRVLVARAGAKPLVLDLDAKVVAEPDLTVGHINEGAGMFVVAIPQKGLALLRPSDGGVIATWDVETNDAVPVPHGVVTVDSEGTVRVGCLHDNALREAAKVATGQKLAIIQHVGDRIALMGGGANPVWVASFSNPCH